MNVVFSGYTHDIIQGYNAVTQYSFNYSLKKKKTRNYSKTKLKTFKYFFSKLFVRERERAFQ